MIETGNESQPSAQLLLLIDDATVVGCTEVLFQPSFSLCCSTRCLQSLSSNMLSRNMRRTTRWLRYGVGDQRTISITRPYTAQSERALVRLIDTSSLQAVCIKPKESCTCHPCVDCVTSFVVLLVLFARHYTRTSRTGPFFFHVFLFFPSLFVFPESFFPSFFFLPSFFFFFSLVHFVVEY